MAERRPTVIHCPFPCNSRINHYLCGAVVVEVDDVLADRELEVLEYSVLLELEEDDEALLEEVAGGVGFWADQSRFLKPKGSLD